MNNLGTNFYQVDTTPTIQYGTESYDSRTGNRYIYLPGVASLAANDFCVYNVTFTAGSATTNPVATYATTRAVTGSKGTAVVSLGANTSTTGGSWFLKEGNCVVNSTGATSGGPVYLHATAGNISSTTNANNTVLGGLSKSATGSGTSLLQLVPCMLNGVS